MNAKKLTKEHKQNIKAGMIKFWGKNRKEQIHHKNGDKTDNRIENLELTTIGEHQKLHSIENKLGKNRKGISPANKTNNEMIKKIKKLRENGYLLKEICEITKLSYPTVQKYSKEEN